MRMFSSGKGRDAHATQHASQSHGRGWRQGAAVHAALLLQVRHGVRKRTCTFCATLFGTRSAVGRVTSRMCACSSISLHSPVSRLALIAVVSVQIMVRAGFSFKKSAAGASPRGGGDVDGAMNEL